jgi:hypothetical protein
VKNFGSTQEALAYLEAIVAAEQRMDRERLLFRGERKDYLLRTSLDRITSGDRLAHWLILHDLVSYLFDYLESQVTVTDGGIYVRGKPLDILQEVEKVQQYVGGGGASRYFAPVFQHYGWASYCLDVSYDPRVALFFASYNFSEERFEKDGKGYIYCWDPNKVRQKSPFLWVVDLVHLCQTLKTVLNVSPIRPERQKGASIILGYYDFDRPDPAYSVLSEEKVCFTFDRADAEDILHPKSFYFPDDELHNFLRTHEAHYTAHANRSFPADDIRLPTLAAHQQTYLNDIANSQICEKLGVTPETLLRYRIASYRLWYFFWDIIWTAQKQRRPGAIND